MTDRLESLAHNWNSIQKYHDIITELNAFVEVSRYKEVDVTINDPSKPEIHGKKIDRDMINGFKKQIKSRSRAYQQVVESMVNRLKIQKTPRILPLKPDGYINTLSYPVVVSDVVKKFFQNVNLGNTMAKEYVSRGHADGFFADGRDRDSMRAMHKKVFPMSTVTDDDLDSFSVHSRMKNLIFDSNVANGSILSHLFSLYTKVNRLASSKPSRIHTSEEFMKYVFDQKASFVVDGKDILSSIDFSPFEDKMVKLVDLLDEAEQAKKQSWHDCDSWNKADRNPPKDPSRQIYKLYHNNSYHDLLVKYTNDQNQLKVHKKEASDLIRKMFNTTKEVANPAPILKKILNRNKTFGEIIKEYTPSKNNGDPFIPNGSEASGTDHWGYSMTMVGVMKSYMMVPSVMMDLVGNQYKVYVQDEEVIKATAQLEHELSQLSKC